MFIYPCYLTGVFNQFFYSFFDTKETMHNAYFSVYNPNHFAASNFSDQQLFFNIQITQNKDLK